VLHVVDVATGRILADTIDRTPFVPPSWREDGRSFYYFRTPKLRLTRRKARATRKASSFCTCSAPIRTR